MIWIKSGLKLLQTCSVKQHSFFSGFSLDTYCFHLIWDPFGQPVVRVSTLPGFVCVCVKTHNVPRCLNLIRGFVFHLVTQSSLYPSSHLPIRLSRFWVRTSATKLMSHTGAQIQWKTVKEGDCREPEVWWRRDGETLALSSWWGSWTASDGATVEDNVVEKQPTVQRLPVLLLSVGVEGTGERTAAAEESHREGEENTAGTSQQVRHEISESWINSTPIIKSKTARQLSNVARLTQENCGKGLESTWFFTFVSENF